MPATFSAVPAVVQASALPIPHSPDGVPAHLAKRGFSTFLAEVVCLTGRLSRPVQAEFPDGVRSGPSGALASRRMFSRF